MLSLKQRFLMDTYGYIVVPDLVEESLMARVREAMDRMDQEIPTVPSSQPYPEGKTRKYVGTPYFSKFGPCIEYDPSFLELAMHPKVIEIAEELVGGPVRYEEQECSINRREPGTPDEIDIKSLGWHRGIGPDFSHYRGNGAHHFLWVKAIVFLTDLGPDDGGTSVIAGSHRFPASTAEMVADLEPWMVHQAQGSAGSVLFFSEALVHAVTPILSDKTRYIMITGYIPPFMREYERCTPTPEFLASVSPKERAFLTGDSPDRPSRYSFRRS